MERLRSRDLRVLLEVIQGAYASLDPTALQTYLVQALPAIIPAEFTTYNHVDLRARTNTVVSNPGIPPDSMRAFNQHLSEHPLIAYYRRSGDGLAVRFSDVLPQRQFRRLGIYAEFFRPLRLQHQMATVLQFSPAAVVGISLSRTSADFSDRERLSLNLLRPHLVQAHQNAEVAGRLRAELAIATLALETSRDGIVVLAHGRVRTVTARARGLLMKYFGRDMHSTGRLPDDVHRWVRSHDNTGRRTANTHPPRTPLVVNRAGERLVVRFVTTSGRHVLLLEEEQDSVDAAFLERLGLTRREAEVIGAVICGKTDTEIGATLGTSRHTVAKHLQHIYEKLGVRTRTAAAAVVLRVIRAPGYDGRASSLGDADPEEA